MIENLNIEKGYDAGEYGLWLGETEPMSGNTRRTRKNRKKEKSWYSRRMKQ